MDAAGQTQRYAALVLATGSKPFIPHLPGVRLPGVYTFRDLGDAEELLERQARSNRTVVLGGGLLGLEAARGMHRFDADVCIVPRADRLMPRQLDAGAAAQWQTHVESTGIEVMVANSVQRIVGKGAVSAVLLDSGRVLPETLVGAKPWVYRNSRAGVYRKIATYDGRLVGAIGVGDWGVGDWNDLARI